MVGNTLATVVSGDMGLLDKWKENREIRQDARRDQVIERLYSIKRPYYEKHFGKDEGRKEALADRAALGERSYKDLKKELKNTYAVFELPLRKTLAEKAANYKVSNKILTPEDKKFKLYQVEKDYMGNENSLTHIAKTFVKEKNLSKFNNEMKKEVKKGEMSFGLGQFIADQISYHKMMKDSLEGAKTAQDKWVNSPEFKKELFDKHQSFILKDIEKSKDPEFTYKFWTEGKK